MKTHPRYGLCAAVGGIAALAIVGLIDDIPSYPQPDIAITARPVPVSPEAVRRAIRPIPEVISKPKPFRLAESFRDDAVLQVVASTDVPVTRQISFPAAPFSINPPATAERGSSHDAAEIRGMMRTYLEAFNRHDTAELAAHWSPDAESVDLDSGLKTQGREAVAGVFAALFARDAAAAIDIDIESIKPVRNDVAVVDGVSRLSFDDASHASSRFSAVVVRDGGRWVLSSVRESAASAPADARQPLDQLEWLVGSWEDIDEACTAATHCSWNGQRSFITRSHVVTADAGHADAANGIPALLPAAGAAREISEIIGWDPELRQIRSWVFSSDGRFAEGLWTRTGESWEVRYEGRGADSGDSCLCTIQRLGADELVISCEPSPLAEILPPAADFVRTAYLGR